MKILLDTIINKMSMEEILNDSRYQALHELEELINSGQIINLDKTKTYDFYYNLHIYYDRFNLNNHRNCRFIEYLSAANIGYHYMDDMGRDCHILEYEHIDIERNFEYNDYLKSLVIRFFMNALDRFKIDAQKTLNHKPPV